MAKNLNLVKVLADVYLQAKDDQQTLAQYIEKALSNQEYDLRCLIGNHDSDINQKRKAFEATLVKDARAKIDKFADEHFPMPSIKNVTKFNIDDEIEFADNRDIKFHIDDIDEEFYYDKCQKISRSLEDQYERPINSFSIEKESWYTCIKSFNLLRDDNIHFERGECYYSPCDGCLLTYEGLPFTDMKWDDIKYFRKATDSEIPVRKHRFNIGDEVLYNGNGYTKHYTIAGIDWRGYFVKIEEVPNGIVSFDDEFRLRLIEKDHINTEGANEFEKRLFGIICKAVKPSVLSTEDAWRIVKENSKELIDIIKNEER